MSWHPAVIVTVESCIITAFWRSGCNFGLWHELDLPTMEGVNILEGYCIVMVYL
jgi:hypothetical protein